MDIVKIVWEKIYNFCVVVLFTKKKSSCEEAMYYIILHVSIPACYGNLFP